MGKYGVLNFIKGLLFIIGSVAVLIGGIMLMIDVVKIASNQQPVYGNFQLGFSYLNIITSVSTVISGVLFLAFGELIQVAVDIAVNTTELVESGRETTAFFSRVAAKTNSAPEPPRR